MTNHWTLTVATRNGSGSQSANLLISKTLFRMGVTVGAKNLFPSNIQGLPTWFSIRVHPDGYVSRQPTCNIMVAMNPDSFEDDTLQVQNGAYFIYNSEAQKNDSLPKGTVNISVPFRELVKEVTSSVKLAKLLTNMIYVGIVTELLNLDETILQSVLSEQFADKATLIAMNAQAIQVGKDYVINNLANIKKDFPYSVKSEPGKHRDKIFIDGNSASALGLTFGGCTFMSWYPITPSSSLAESYVKYSQRFQKNKAGENRFAVIQAEDELSAINMVLGAGWVGSRAVTATSGPGLSLMSEAAGLSYFAEIPAVIWDVQRAGPSTGLPTRTLQGDISSAYKLSHGDTQHIVLIPGNAKECFEFAKIAMDLAEQLQTLVIVLTDLDLGMNFQISDKFTDFTKLERGKVLDAKSLDQIQNFQRYADTDGDGIPYRTLPGNEHPKAGYFTRGTGHNEQAAYSEKPEDFKKLLDRLHKKHKTAEKFVPAALIDNNAKAKIGIIAYGSSDFAIPELRHKLSTQLNLTTSYLRLRSLPFNDEVFAFIEKHEQVFIVEQNRDAQIKGLILEDSRLVKNNLKSVCSYDGLPLCVDHLFANIQAQLGGDHVQ